MPLKCLLSLVLLMFIQASNAAEIRELNTSLRALGMGNAFTSIVSNSDALFYNPAGLADAGYSLRLVDVGVGLSGVEAYADFQGLEDSAGFADQVEALYGDKIWLGIGGKAAVTLPYLAFAYFGTSSSTLQINNPAYPNIEANVVADYGMAIGFAVPLGPFLDFGASILQIKRTGADVVFEAGTLAELDPDVIRDRFSVEGDGYALNLGLNLTIDTPIKPTVSLAWRNVGTTSFRPSVTGGVAPPSEPDEIVFGASVQVDAGLFAIRPSFDYKHSNREGVQIGKKLHLGLELDLPLIDLRAGFNQGYYTAGATLGLGIFEIEAATWGVELGEYPGQLEDRRYGLQFIFELGFDAGLSFLGGGSGRGGRNGGSGRRRGLKQRR